MRQKCRHLPPCHNRSPASRTLDADFAEAFERNVSSDEDEVEDESEDEEEENLLSEALTPGRYEYVSLPTTSTNFVQNEDVVVVLFTTGWERGKIVDIDNATPSQKRAAKRFSVPRMVRYVSDSSFWLHDLDDPAIYLSEEQFNNLIVGSNEESEGVKVGTWCVVRRIDSKRSQSSGRQMREEEAEEVSEEESEEEEESDEEEEGGDPPWRPNGHRFIGQTVKVGDEGGCGQLGTIVGWIADTDVDMEGNPGFVSERTGKPACLFNVEFSDDTSQDFEEDELQGKFFPASEISKLAAKEQKGKAKGGHKSCAVPGCPKNARGPSYEQMCVAHYRQSQTLDCGPADLAGMASNAAHRVADVTGPVSQCHAENGAAIDFSDDFDSMAAAAAASAADGGLPHHDINYEEDIDYGEEHYEERVAKYHVEDEGRLCFGTVVNSGFPDYDPNVMHWNVEFDEEDAVVYKHNGRGNNENLDYDELMDAFELYKKKKHLDNTKPSAM